MFITKRTFRSQLLIVVLSVLLPAMAVVAFLLHHRAEQQLRYELMTSAVKHGALSVAAGRIALRWGIDGDAFVFEWREANGPIVVEPVKTGFGT